ncbi:MAG: magnesium transporter CorA [Bacteroidetes bacterium]|nr:magnesium transporter CorA [Bacteroidota bacterium]
MKKTINHSTWSSEKTTWIDITDPTHAELKEYSKQYNLEYYSLADCLEPAHLPKKETLQDFTFIILRVYDDKAKNPSSIQEMSHKIAIYYNDKVVLTIHRVHAAIIEEIRAKYLETGVISEPSEIVTKIMYYTIKSYEANAISLSEKIDRMEKLVFVGRQTRITLEHLYYLKNTCRLNRRIISLSKEVILQHTTTEKDAGALQDVKDLLQKLSLSFDETHDDAANLSTIYLSIVSLKTNDVMKLLTIFSVFFMPLTFIAGIYGMNFDVMPELRWKLGYPLILIVMSLISFVIFWWFKRKKIL